jgi:hypothetical protein
VSGIFWGVSEIIQQQQQKKKRSHSPYFHGVYDHTEIPTVF